jgi:osmotically-inducible protein OsmY
MTNIFFTFSLICHPQPAGALIWRTIAYVGVLALTVTVAGCGTHLGGDTEVSDRNERMAAEVKLALVQQADLNAAAIDVKALGGVVTLGGFVEHEDQRQAAEITAGRVTGVTSVINTIHLK